MDTDSLADRVVGAALGFADILSISLGSQLGLYRHLADSGPLTPDELAERSAIGSRYAREWLEQQATTGFLGVADDRFGLPESHRPVLVDPDSLAYLAPLADLMAAAGAKVHDLVEAYRSGDGVPWQACGPLMRSAQGAGNRPWFLGPLVDEWLPSIPGLVEMLDGGTRVLEVGCGEGWASIAIADRWPSVVVDAIDIDEASATAARQHTASAGLDGRIHVHTDPATLDPQIRYGLIAAFECLHDMPDPVGVLTALRGRLADDGVLLVMDERAADTLEGEGDELQRLLYGWSLLICLPDLMSHPGSVATGTVMRPATLQQYASAAGFASVEVLPIEHDLWRFYRLHQ